MHVLPEIISYGFTPNWQLDLSNDDYHADRSAVSSTGLRRILKSPRAFAAGQIAEPEETNALRFGHAVHLAILEPKLFEKLYVIMPRFAGTGSVKAKADWRLTLDAGAVILKEDEYNDLLEMINSVQRHQDACNILKNGKAEMSGYFADPDTGIKCRIRPDFFHEGLMALLDVKTTQDIEMSSFSKTIWKYRYDFQAAFYCEGIRLITGKNVQYPLFLALEKNPPFEVAVYMADEGMMAKGLMDYRFALNKLKECIEVSSWTGYQSKIQPISLPRWATTEV